MLNFQKFLLWLSKQSIARIFGYTRHLERMVNSQSKIYMDQIRLIREENDSEVSFLHRELQELKTERQALVDRLLAKNGFSPIWHKEPEKEKPKPQAYKPAFEAAMDDAEEEHRNFKSIMESAKQWAAENQKAE